MPAKNKIFNTFSDFELKLQALRVKEDMIVFTNGCFDILHPGHVNLLEKAKALGDILVLGLNTDASIKGLKGNSRPIQDQNARALVLAGLESVDFIIPFNTPTPLDLIKNIRPDILVKGGDYNIKEIVGFDFVKSYGGEVTTIPFLEGHSSSHIINKIKDN
jgi:rfaE bifunctional protein nucleotidyltransferase chain/domain